MHRQIVLASMLVAGATACAARAPQSTLTASYSCDGDHKVRRSAGQVSSSESGQLTMGWQDTEGDHFVSWPAAATTMEATEFVMPRDSRADAIERIYDTSKGTSRADWRMVKNNTCTANGGYSDALARFVKGKSFDQISQELSLNDKAAARDLVHEALLSAQKRYYKDR